MTKHRVTIIGLLAAVMLAALPSAHAQDIPGIENCTAEKAMDRRTSCLQTNVNYLKAMITQLQTVSFARLEAANRQIDALKASLVTMQATITELKAAADKKPADTAKPDAQKNAAPADTTKK